MKTTWGTILPQPKQKCYPEPIGWLEEPAFAPIELKEITPGAPSPRTAYPKETKQILDLLGFGLNSGKSEEKGAKMAPKENIFESELETADTKPLMIGEMCEGQEGICKVPPDHEVRPSFIGARYGFHAPFLEYRHSRHWKLHQMDRK